jgi:hypothetical protein
MSLPSYLAKPLRWLRAVYPSGAPRHGHVPLIALMTSPAAQTGKPPGAGETSGSSRSRDLRPDQAVAAGWWLPMSVPRLASACGLAR